MVSTTHLYRLQVLNSTDKLNYFTVWKNLMLIDIRIVNRTEGRTDNKKFSKLVSEEKL